MACYWGFETTGNKIAWGCVVLFVLIGAAFWFPGVIELKKCMNRHTMCMCRATPSGGLLCADSSRDADRALQCSSEYISCRRTPAVVWSIGWLFLVLLSWLPCCYFCCCSRNPKDTYMAQQGVQMGPGMPPTGQVYQYQQGYQQQYVAGPAAAAAVPAYPAAFAPTGSGPVQQQFSGNYTLPPQQSSYVDNVPVHRY